MIIKFVRKLSWIGYCTPFTFRDVTAVFPDLRKVSSLLSTKKDYVFANVARVALIFEQT